MAQLLAALEMISKYHNFLVTGLSHIGHLFGVFTMLDVNSWPLRQTCFCVIRPGEGAEAVLSLASHHTNRPMK